MEQLFAVFDRMVYLTMEVAKHLQRIGFEVEVPVVVVLKVCLVEV